MFSRVFLSMLLLGELSAAEEPETDAVEKTEPADATETEPVDVEEAEEEDDDILDLDDDEDEDEDDINEGITNRWDKDLTEADKKERFSYCLNMVRAKAVSKEEPVASALAALKTEPQYSKMTDEEGMNFVMFHIISVCYKQIEPHLPKLRKQEALTSEEGLDALTRKDDTPPELQPDQYAVLEGVIKADNEKQQAAQQQQATQQQAEATSWFWVAYLLAVFGVLFGLGFMLITHLKNLDQGSSHKVKGERAKNKENRRRMKVA